MSKSDCTGPKANSYRFGRKRKVTGFSDTGKSDEEGFPSEEPPTRPDTPSKTFKVPRIPPPPIAPAPILPKIPPDPRIIDPRQLPTEPAPPSVPESK